MRAPSPPSPNLRDLLREYTSLALTRIDDLKQSSFQNKPELAVVLQEVCTYLCDLFNSVWLQCLASSDAKFLAVGRRLELSAKLLL